MIVAQSSKATAGSARDDENWLSALFGSPKSNSNPYRSNVITVSDYGRGQHKSVLLENPRRLLVTTAVTGLCLVLWVVLFAQTHNPHSVLLLPFTTPITFNAHGKPIRRLRQRHLASDSTWNRLYEGIMQLKTRISSFTSHNDKGMISLLSRPLSQKRQANQRHGDPPIEAASKDETSKSKLSPSLPTYSHHSLSRRHDDATTTARERQQRQSSFALDGRLQNHVERL
mmetsp:Transcript_8908/g.24687  ORF Transcript_8908/g.24687 Transcript_8908/m.24687 type:complete len:228 (-) Transcript_8908:93-776(-)